MSTARFGVFGALDGAGGFQKGTVEIDRATGEFFVRPHRRKKRYSLPLSAVATMVCQAIIRSELREKIAAKKAKKNK